MAADFSLNAVISATYDSFTSGMDAVVSAATSAGRSIVKLD
jgi:hypothetical protein